MATEIIKQIVITVCNCFQFLFDQMFDIQSEVYNTECQRAREHKSQVQSVVVCAIPNSKKRETNHFKMTQKTMHSCLKKMSTTGSTFLLLDPRSGDSE